MTGPPNSKNDSLKTFAAWSAALFLIVFGAQLWVAQLYGSPLPLWDQWYEAATFFRPWVEGSLTWQDFFAAHNEHRIVVTRVFDLGVIWLNGRWDTLLQMTVNASIHAAFACGLAFGLWDFLGRKNGWFICFLLLPFFALPYAGENAIWAFNSQQYFMSIFSLATLAGLGFAKPGSRCWWFGFAAAVMNLFTMASGFLAPVAVAGLIILRMARQRQLGNMVTLGWCFVLMGLGLALHVTIESDRPLQAHSLTDFVSALTRNLTWPFFNAPIMAFVFALPLVWLVIWYFRSKFPETRAAEFVLTLALWSGLQSAALAYGRANYGEAIPASRYMDVLNVFVIASLFATLLLGCFWLRGAFSKKFALLLPLVFAAVIFFGLCRISQIVVEDLLIPTRMMNLIAEERVETFLASGDERDLFEQPTVRPDPKIVLEVLRDAKLQTILPAVCLSPTSTPLTGRFTTVAQWLLRNATMILYCGLGLFTGLIGFNLARHPLGLAWENLPAFIALLTMLAALGFVWTKAPIKRETIERVLQYKLADSFKAANNPKRAAIHEHKAELLEDK